VQGSRNLQDVLQRNVAHSALRFSQIVSVNAGEFGQSFLAQPSFEPQFAHSFSKHQQRIRRFHRQPLLMG